MLYCDLDGVLADFDAQYFKVTGTRSSKTLDNVDWSKVEAKPMFYANCPLMPGALDMWRFLTPMQPVILTGLPATIPGAGAQKRAWVATHLGEHVEVITCASQDKARFCQPGDILIDDWTKYRDLWVAKGGLFLTYRSAPQVMRALEEMR